MALPPKFYRRSRRLKYIALAHVIHDVINEFSNFLARTVEKMMIEHVKTEVMYYEFMNKLKGRGESR